MEIPLSGEIMQRKHVNGDCILYTGLITKDISDVDFPSVCTIGEDSEVPQIDLTLHSC